MTKGSLRSIAALGPPLLTSDDVAAGSGGQKSFKTYVGDMTDQRDLVLACVFDRFDAVVPPAESDAASHPKLAGLKKKLRAAPGKESKPADEKSLAEQTEFWAEEAIASLGLDRLGLKRPDMALQRLIKKEALRPTKIGGRLLFKKEDLDRVREKGDQARRRGRPRRDAR